MNRLRSLRPASFPAAALAVAATVLVGCASDGPATLQQASVASAVEVDIDGRTTETVRRQLAELQPGATLEVEVLFGDAVSDAEALAAVDEASAFPMGQRLRFGQVLAVEGTEEALLALAAHPSVVVVSEAPRPLVTRVELTPVVRNEDSRDSSNADAVAPGGAAGYALDGEGIMLGVIDEGPIRTSHVDFGGRVIYRDADGDLSSHATHVAGTMVGAGVGRDDAAGFAPAARAFGWTFQRDTIELMSRVGVELVASNHSYGYDLGWDRDGRWVGDEGFGKYSLDARRADLAIERYDILWVKAAGNDNGDGEDTATESRPFDCSTGFDCVPGGSVAKNMVIVAAIADLTEDPPTPGSAVVTGFSSVGPADDGRVKPDIAANGASVLSTGHTGDGSYVRLSGTSMAAPSVTGGVALIVEHYRELLGYDPGADEVRGLLTHTALWNDDVGRPLPTLGWGVMDVLAAVKFIDRHAEDGHIVRGLYDGSPQSFTLTAEAGEPLWVTLAWLDPAGDVNTGRADDRTPALVNDLDLRASHAGATYHPWRLNAADPAAPATANGPNRVDNLERIVIPASETEDGLVTLTLEHEGAITGSEQSFVLMGSAPLTAGEEVALFGSQRVVRVRASNDDLPSSFALPISVRSGGSVGFEIAETDLPFWLTIDTESGTLPTDTPTVTIDARGLSPTLHTATLRVLNTSTDGARDHFITILLDVRGLEFPVVDAGDRFTVPTGALTRLRGNAYDPGGDTVDVTWAQTAGPSVVLSATNTIRPSFVAPTVTEPTTLRFSLVARTGDLESAPDAADVVVIPTTGPNEPLDNRCETAPEVASPFDGAGELAPHHDVDFFAVTMEADETLTAETFQRGEAIDTLIGATSADGTVLATNDDGGTGLYSRLAFTAPSAGTYCVAVSTYADSLFDGVDARTGGTYGLTISVDRPNVPPVADAGPNQTVNAGTVVSLDATASDDPDGFTLGYAWTQTSGIEVTLAPDNGPQPRFVAPINLVSPEVLTFAVEVFDADGDRDTDAVQVTVNPAPVDGPIADAGADRTVPVGAFAQLTGSGLAVDGGTLAFAWSQISGPAVTLVADDATVAFAAPTTPGDVVLQLEVTEGAETGTDTVVVSAIATEGADEPENNWCDTAPTLGRSALVPVDETVVGALQPQHDVDFYRVDVLEGSTLDFEVGPNGPRIDTTMGLFRQTEDGWELRATDDDGGDETFSRITGESGADGTLCVAVSTFRDFTFDGGDADAGGSYLLRVVVTPPEGANLAPEAEAGDDIDASPGALVELDGSASVDPEGEPLDYTWTLVDGPITVDIFDPLAVVAQASMPVALAEEGQFMFQLEVFDGAFRDSDTMTVTVPPNRAPTLDAIERIEVNVGEPVSFTASASDPDGDAVTLEADELPEGATFDPETGTFDWVADEAGFFTPRVEARDVYGARAERFVTVLVVDRDSENRPPVVEPVEDMEVVTDDTPATLRFEVVASDPDGDPLEYFWQLSDRTFLGVTQAVSADLEYGVYTVECFVSDGEATTRAAFTVTVRSDAPTPPIADAGLDQVVRTVTAEDTAPIIPLDGRASVDPMDRGALAFDWSVVQGPELELFGADTAIPTFEQPVGEGVVRFALEVSVEVDGETVTSEVSEVEVRFETGLDNARPGALIEGPGIVEDGDVVAYSAAGSEDPDGDDLAFFWSVEAGAATLSDAAAVAPEVTFGAPGEDGWELVLLTHDGFAYSRVARAALRPPGSVANNAPIADARLVGSPRPGNTVQLDASDSFDPDDDELTFTWTQVSGPDQALSSENRPVAEVALSGAEGDEIAFEVVVSDGTDEATAAVRFLLLASTNPGEDTGADAGVDAPVGGDTGVPPVGGGGGGGGGCATTGSTPAAPVWLLLLAIGAAVRVRRRTHRKS